MLSIQFQPFQIKSKFILIGVKITFPKGLVLRYTSLVCNCRQKGASKNEKLLDNLISNLSPAAIEATCAIAILNQS